MTCKLPIMTGLCLIFFISCSTKEENLLNESETKMIIGIPVIVAEPAGEKSTSGQLKTEYPFSGAEFYTPAEANSESLATRIHRIEPLPSAVLIIPGAESNGEIVSLSLEWGFLTNANGDYSVQEQIDLSSLDYSFSGGNYRINMGNALDQMINRMSEDKEDLFKISLSGNTTFNITGFATLEIPVKVTSELFSPRFQLY